VRAYRAINRIEPLACDHIDKGYCTLKQVWCCSVSNCQVKGTQPVEKMVYRKLSDTEINIIKQTLAKHKVISESVIKDLAIRLGRTESSMRNSISRVRNNKVGKKKGRKNAKDNQSKQQSHTEVCS
jgi:hypothetical protein